MKIYRSLIYIMALAVMINACKKSDTKPTGTMSAKIETTSWNAKTITDTIAGNTVNIIGRSSDNSTITLYLDAIRTGIFLVNDTSLHSANFLPVNGTSSYTTSYGTNSGGEINVTSINNSDSLMSGTFYFTAVDPLSGATVTVTEGKFDNLNFKELMTNYMHAEIDGTGWTAGVVNGNLALGGKLTLKGSVTNNAKFINIVVPGNILPGTYTLGGLLSSYYGQYNPTVDVSMYSYSGTLVITKHDTANNRIEGSFNFSALEFQGTTTAVISKGVFRISYTAS